MSRILSTLQRQLLPLGLIAAAVVGILLPRPGQFMAQLPTQYVAVATIFVCSGLLLRTQDLRAALSGWPAAVWGCLAILFITPAIGVPLALLVPVEESFRLGLALFCCMPTTLSSGIALTAQARGNVALALLLTVLSNALGILTVPFVLAHLLGFLGEIELSAGDLLAKLCLVILVPLSLGCYLRRFAEEWIAGHRSTITTVSNLALISVPWMKFSQSSVVLSQVALANLGLIAISGLVIHVLYLLLNNVATRLLGLPLAARKAVVIVASQKTLPVAMTVLAVIPESTLSSQIKGVVAIPCITFHLTQIITDAIVATKWRRVSA